MYEVQVGAFEHQGHAQAVLAQVRDWFHRAYLTPRQGPDGLYDRVRVGPFTDKAAAQRPGLTRGGHRVLLDDVPETALPPAAPPPAPDDPASRSGDGERQGQAPTLGHRRLR